jgi:hypothetical protein
MAPLNCEKRANETGEIGNAIITRDKGERAGVHSHFFMKQNQVSGGKT